MPRRWKCGKIGEIFNEMIYKEKRSDMPSKVEHGASSAPLARWNESSEIFYRNSI
jgi:hypothetical protein